MIAISTSWNADRTAGWTGAVRQLVGIGHRHVALDGATLFGDAAGARRELRAKKGSVVALFAPPGHNEPGTSGLASLAEGAGRAGIKKALACASAAARAGTPRVVLRVGSPPILDGDRQTVWMDRLMNEGRNERLQTDVRRTLAAARPDRERSLEALCRRLHTLLAEKPDVHWLLTTPSCPDGVATATELEMVFSEFPRRKLGYWHDVAHAAKLEVLGVGAQDEWLGRLAERTEGVTVADWSPLGDRMPPGSGHVDWRTLRFQIREGMTRVLALDPAYDIALLADALREAGALGF